MEATAAQNPNWLELPPEVTASILRRLGAVELLETAQKVCTTWRSICKDPAMWRTVDIRSSRETNLWLHDVEKITMRAVDLSCGQLEGITIANFASDHLLLYIADRSSQLKRLQLVHCYGNISPETFREAFKKLPLLEELHIYFTAFDKGNIEVAGRFCTLLKSFKLNRQAYKHPGKCDEEALAIAESMPELRHLQLFGSTMTDDGLGAILDKCPHLESLDLRQCFNVSLAGDVGKRCFERIKDLKRPLDSTDGCGFDTVLLDSGKFDSDSDYDYGIDYDEQVYGYDDDHLDMNDPYYRSSQLKRLRLVRCYEGISPEAFSEAFKKLPLLEELHLYFTVFGKQVIEVAGSFYTLLKSFKLNRHSYEHLHKCDDEALAIAESLPELRSLQLFGMTDDGLLVILDKCPHLDSLDDLRLCFNVTLAGSVGYRCFERIKDSKRPHDSTDGCGFRTVLFPGEVGSDFEYVLAPPDFPLVYGKDDYHGMTDSSDINSLDYDGVSDPNHPDC
ncbi:hypothetical protein RJ639_022674 [Escallonia herrerae]|uniref:F-box domain-containing protein n=1 Tax=Escallonia herrerae TaxID=1293975 RepID=A0AA88UZK7_9ASTE|nr:hypothetical protein RJ639_022674 [Escallonia herrerae]